jgi:hypothetical protein
LIYGGVKNVMGCLCTPYVCSSALEWALWCFKKVDEIRSERHSEMHISKQTEAEFSIKYGRCMVRQGRKVEGMAKIKKGLKIRKKCFKKSPNTKNRVLLASCYNDLAGTSKYLFNTCRLKREEMTILFYCYSYIYFIYILLLFIYIYDIKITVSKIMALLIFCKFVYIDLLLASYNTKKGFYQFKPLFLNDATYTFSF